MRVSVVSLGGEPARRYLEQVKLAEKQGFHAFFHNDKKWAREVFARLGAASQATSTIGLGTSVVDPYTRHPAVVAQATATLAEMAPGRFRVIMGSGSHFETLPGYDSPKPVVALREASQLMRALWNGEKVTIDGEVVKFKDGSLDWKPTAKPELYIASRGPQILALGGRIADGVLVGSFATPPGIQYARQHIQTGLDDSGRTWNDIQLCSWIYVSVLDDEDEPVPDSIRRGVSFAFWSSRPVLSAMVDRLASDITFLRDAPRSWAPDVMAELRRLIPRGVIDSLAIVGTTRQIVQRLQDLQRAGVQEVILWPFPKDGQDTEGLLAKIASDVLPHVSGR